MVERQFLWSQVAVDGILLLCVVIPLAILKFCIHPHYQGFYCDDDSIRYPFKESTVTSLTLQLVGTGLPIIMILICEAINLWLERLNPGSFQSIDYFIGRLRSHRFLIRIYKFIGFFLFGACVCELLTMIGKLTVGRLRPNFIAVCQPPLEVVCAGNNHSYINPTCTNPDLTAVEESRVSFPSGHSSFSFYCAIFTVIYLEARGRWPRERVRPFFKPIVQFTLICMATLCALSRISDNKHHPTDVFSGSVLGILVSLLTTIHIGKFFKKKTVRNKEQRENNFASSGNSRIQTSASFSLQNDL